ncbi:MAG: glucose-6-phosphate isomerase [Halioglobus sp.]
MTPNTLLNSLPAYSTAISLAEDLKQQSIAGLFAADPRRAEDFNIEAAGLRLDYSKALLSREGLSVMLELASDANWASHVKDLLSGETVNPTEDRPALHTLLRASTSAGVLDEKFAEVSATRERMAWWAQQFNEGKQRGYDDQVITDIVNIGIGGSDLGPRLASEALTPYHGNVACHYVANVDPADLQDTLLSLNPGSTAFIICSKSFRTEETLTNSLAARQWLVNAGAAEADLDKHFIAITTNLTAAREFGIPEANCLPLWDWVGGRYSVWSAVGLSTAISIGWENFAAFLAGAEAMDNHLREAPAAENLPLLLSLMEVWYCNFMDAGNCVVLPYSHHLQRLPNFLQQLTMESNGKQVSSEGTPLDYNTSPVLWGTAGTMGQHSYHQLLHQGTQLCPADFILPLTTHTGMEEQHRKLVANCLAQSRTMMIGRTTQEARQSLLSRGMTEAQATSLAPHLSMPGNRPNSVITMEVLDPSTLGALLALYEHRTFLSGKLWGINPFDQWGVELGKEIGTDIFQRLSDQCPAGVDALDPSTEMLMDSWRSASESD